MSRIKLLVTIFGIFYFVCSGYAANTDVTLGFTADGEPFYGGPITKEAVAKFIEQNKNINYKRITINSGGGDAEAGLHFGMWIAENNIDVRVQIICMSSCPNYVFMAAKNKYIPRGSVVIWHGSLEQKDIREESKYYEFLLNRSINESEKMSAEEIDFLNSRKFKYETTQRLRKLQADFYSKIEANEYITRLGQEPFEYGIDGWTTTVAVMNKMGVNNVFTDPEYGSDRYMKSNILAKIMSKGNPLVFDLNKNNDICEKTLSKFNKCD